VRYKRKVKLYRKLCEEEIAGQARRGKQNIKTGTVDAGMGSGRELAKRRIDFGD